MPFSGLFKAEGAIRLKLALQLIWLQWQEEIQR